MQLDTELTVQEEIALLSWLEERDPDDTFEDDEDLAALRQALAPWLASLPERIRNHLEQLMTMEREVESREIQAAQAETVDEHDRAALEESLRRLLAASTAHRGRVVPWPRGAPSTDVGRCAPT